MTEIAALQKALHQLGRQYVRTHEQQQRSAVLPTGWTDLDEVCGRMLAIARELESRR